jgi:hypothetical protein
LVTLPTLLTRSAVVGLRIVLIVGLALLIVGRTGRQIGGRAHYW